MLRTVVRQWRLRVVLAATVDPPDLIALPRCYKQWVLVVFSASPDMLPLRLRISQRFFVATLRQLFPA
jgi:hypothetical protein